MAASRGSEKRHLTQPSGGHQGGLGSKPLSGEREKGVEGMSGSSSSRGKMQSEKPGEFREQNGSRFRARRLVG